MWKSWKSPPSKHCIQTAGKYDPHRLLSTREKCMLEYQASFHLIWDCIEHKTTELQIVEQAQNL